MSISEASEKLNTINTNYRQQIVDQNATSHETSLLYSKDNAFIEFLENDICNSIDSYKIALGKIEPPSNYTITRDDLSSLRSAINTGIGHLGTYPNTILQKSKEVFEEYNEKFNTLKGEYESNSNDALNYINDAQNAQNKLDGVLPPEYITNDKGIRVSNPEFEEYKSYWRGRRDSALNGAASHLSIMNSKVVAMQELLEKGLKKV